MSLQPEPDGPLRRLLGQFEPHYRGKALVDLWEERQSESEARKTIQEDLDQCDDCSPVEVLLDKER